MLGQGWSRGGVRMEEDQNKQENFLSLEGVVSFSSFLLLAKSPGNSAESRGCLHETPGERSLLSGWKDFDVKRVERILLLFLFSLQLAPPTFPVCSFGDRL